MSYKSIRTKMEKIFGKECFIEKLHLRKDDKPRRYKSKGEYKRMKQLHYHHILEKSKGGQETIENGAILSGENHEWLHQQSEEKKQELNNAFQEYKKSVLCKVEFVDELKTDFAINSAFISFRDREKDYDICDR